MKTVKVTKTGNSRALPLPAELAKGAGLDVGDTVTVEVRGRDVIYRHGSPTGLILGEGRGRVAVVPAGRAMRLTGRSSNGALDTWDF